jgi:MFS family permease
MYALVYYSEAVIAADRPERDPPVSSPLCNRTYRHLLAAQVVALAGTGLATVALSLLAYDLAGEDASAVLGTALAIKMTAYVCLGPLAGALAGRIPRRALLVTMDLVRGAVALALPFVTEIWQIYILILLLQAASATFTPTFQATLPDVLPDEHQYTKALSLSRIAYDLENLFSPVLAAALLAFISYDWLFAGTTFGFLASAALVVSVALPKPAAAHPSAGAGGVYAKATLGTRRFLATPRLRALLALDLTVAAAGAMVFVNTVVIVRDHFDRPDIGVSLALGAFGAGSLLTALALPRLLRTHSDRTVMLRAALGLPALAAATAVLTALAPAAWSWWALLAVWAATGAATSAVLTPAGRVIRRSAAAAELPAAFAAQFSLSHACWLLTYPLAGWLAATAGLPATGTTLAALALAAALIAAALWPAHDPEDLGHIHTNLPPHHPHLADARPVLAGWHHRHRYVIDQHHPDWPVPSREKTHAAISRQHGQSLERLGAHHVVLPEHDMGKRVAHLVTGRILDFIEFDDDYALVKALAPQSVVGVALGISGVRTKYGVTVVGIKRVRESFTYATADTVVEPGDVLIVTGKTRAVEAFAELE